MYVCIKYRLITKKKNLIWIRTTQNTSYTFLFKFM